MLLDSVGPMLSDIAAGINLGLVVISVVIVISSSRLDACHCRGGGRGGSRGGGSSRCRNFYTNFERFLERVSYYFKGFMIHSP